MSKPKGYISMKEMVAEYSDLAEEIMQTITDSTPEMHHSVAVAAMAHAYLLADALADLEDMIPWQLQHDMLFMQRIIVQRTIDEGR